MALLRQAVAAGWTGPGVLAVNHDFDALRDREDFKKLVGELKSAQIKKK